jgi:hypothetical protein
VLLPLGNLLVLLAVLALSLSGCARGPKVERCIVDGDEQRLAMDCFDARINARLGYSRTIESADNYICIDPESEERLLKACVEKRPTRFAFCVVASEEKGAWCADSASPIDDGFFLSWPHMANYICTSPADMERLLKWCTQ